MERKNVTLQYSSEFTPYDHSLTAKKNEIINVAIYDRYSKLEQLTAIYRGSTVADT